MKVAKLLIGLSFVSALAAAGGSAYLYHQTQVLKLNNQKLESDLVQLREQNAALKHQADQADSFKQEIERLHDQLKDLLNQRNTLKAESDAQSAKITELEGQIQKIDSEKRELEAKLTLTEAASASAVGPTAGVPAAAPGADALPPLDLPTSFHPSEPSVPESKKEPIHPVTVAADSLPGVPVSEEEEPALKEKKAAPPSAPAPVIKPTTPPVVKKETAPPPQPKQEVKKPEVKKEAPKAKVEQVKPLPEPIPTSPVIKPATDNRPQQVLSVNRQFNFVVVNVGLRDKVKIGDVLRVEENGKLIGKIQVEKLYDNFSACAIMEETRPAQIHEGDMIRIG